MSSWQSSRFKSEAMEHHAKNYRWIQPEKKYTDLVIKHFEWKACTKSNNF